jgi:hypothetical protein
MGYSITKNEKEEFSLTSTISDELLLDKVSEKEIKRFLIEDRLIKCFEDILKIDNDFPNGWRINGLYKMDKDKELFSKKILDTYNNNTYSEFMETNMKRLISEYNLSDYFLTEKD